MAASVALPAHRRPARLDPGTTLDWLRTTAVGRRFDAVGTRYGWPRVLLALAMLAWFAFFAQHSLLRHDRFGTFDHDLGIWDQYVWLLANGHLFNTVRGLEVFAFHVSPAMFLYVPFYWLGAGPSFLNLTMVAALTLGAIPVFQATNHYLRNQWHALVVALAFLVNYAGQWMLQETFHPEVVAITPLLFAYVAATRQRWLPYALWLAFAVAWKEDVALAAIALGFLLLVRRNVKVGLVTMVAAAVWFLLATQVIVPASSPGGNFTEDLFGDLGASPTEIAGTAVSDPGLVYDHLETADALGYGRDLLASFGFVPLLSPLALLIGLPQALVNLLAIHNFFWTTRVHYAAVPLAVVTIATVEGVARPRRLAWRRFLLGAVAVGALGTAAGWGVSIFSPTYRQGYWPLEANDRQEAMDAAIAVPGDDDAVAASYNFVPHLTHRSQIYTFPNPWRLQNWGVAGEGQHDPDTVEWLVVDRRTMSPEDVRLYQQVTADPDWEIVSEEDDVVVVHHRP